MFKKRLAVLGELTLAFAIYWLSKSPTIGNIQFNMFQSRDLDRARALISGQPIFFGPEATGGGHLPGAFFYYLAGLPLWLGFDWPGVYYLMMGLSGLTAAVLFMFARRYFSFWAGAAVFLAYLTSAGIRGNLADFNNSSFVLLFAAAAAIGLILLFSGFAARRAQIWLLVCVAFGFGVQLHMTIMLFALAALILQIFARKLKLRPLSGSEFFPGAAVFNLILSPYFIWSAAGAWGFSFGQPTFPFTGGLINVADFFVQRTGDQIPAAAGPFMQFSGYLISGPILIALGLCLWGSQILSLPQVPSKEFLKKYGVIVLVFVACTLGVTLPLMVANKIRLRYGGCAFLSLILLVPYIVEHLRTLTKVRQWQTGALCVAAGATLSLFQSRLTRGLEGTLNDLTVVSRAIVQQTGWDYEHAKLRLYYLNLPPTWSLRPVYQAEFTKLEQPPTNRQPDGYFFGAVDERFLKGADKKIWITRRVERSMAQGIHDGQIQLGEFTQPAAHFVIVPYFVTDKKKFPASFHNRASEYDSNQDQVINQLLAESQVKPRQAIAAVFNNCPNQPDHCRIVMSAESSNLADPSQPVTLRVLGIPLAFASKSLAPYVNQILYRPVAVFQCDAKTVSVEMAHLLGTTPQTPPWAENNSLQAPYTREIQVDCKGPVRSISLGYKHAAFTHHPDLRQLRPAVKLFTF